MTPDRYRPVDTDEVLRRVDTHARVGAALLGGLGDVGGEDEGREFVSELVTAARNAAEHELADVAFDLARACLAAHEEYCGAGVQVWIDQPRDALELHAALAALKDRVSTSTQLPDAPTPGVESDLRPLILAVDLCRVLEGPSDRVRFLEAQIPAIHERWDDVVANARALAGDCSTPAWRRCALILLSFGLVKKGAPAEALRTIAVVEHEFGLDRVACLNACCAYAQQGDQAGFLKTAEAFASLTNDGLGDNYSTQPVHDKVNTFCRSLDLSRDQVLRAFGLEDAR